MISNSRTEQEWRCAIYAAFVAGAMIGCAQTTVAAAPLAVAVAPSASTDALEFEPVTVPMAARQVSPQCWYVVGQPGMISTANQGFNSNAAFVVTSAGVVVFDALGTPALGRKLREVIGDVTAQPIRRIVASHYHADHIYGLQALTGPGVDVWAHERVRDYLDTPAPTARLAERRQSLAPWVNAKSRVVVPDHYVGDTATFEIGATRFTLLHAGPAHTPEDLMMLVEPDGVLFVGDLMFTGRLPFVADADVSSWIQAIDRVLELKPRLVVGGHGPVSHDAVADLSLTRDYLAYLQGQISAAFDEGLDFDEAYRRIDWSAFSRLPAFDAANRRNAYQTYLNVERDALRGTPAGTEPARSAPARSAPARSAPARH